MNPIVNEPGPRAARATRRRQRVRAGQQRPGVGEQLQAGRGQLGRPLVRLGEGSGAALAVEIVKAAVACHNGMATFAEAGVAGKEEP